MQTNFNADSEVVAIKPESNKLVEFARTVVIKTAEQYEMAARYLKTTKGLLGKIDAAHARVKKPLLEAGRELDQQKNDASAPLLTAEGQIKRAMIAYTDEQERIRQEEQRRLDEAARKERERLAALAREAEAKARAEEERLRKEAADAAAAGRAAEAAKLAARADTAADKGASKAQELQQRAASVVAPVVSREPPKVAGISGRENWYAECTDLMALVKAVAEGRAPISFVVANDKLLGQQARSLKKQFVCDGVRVWSDKNLAAGAA